MFKRNLKLLGLNLRKLGNACASQIKTDHQLAEVCRVCFPSTSFYHNWMRKSSPLRKYCKALEWTENWSWPLLYGAFV
jgi:hypothetical protein